MKRSLLANLHQFSEILDVGSQSNRSHQKFGRIGVAVFVVLVLMVGACTSSVEGGSASAFDDVVNVPAETVCVDCVSGELATELDEAIQSVLADALHIPGVVVGVLSAGDGRYEAGFGYANIAEHTAMETGAVFGIGSVHKTFKWMVMHLLVEQGLLSLDDEVNDYIEQPDLPGVTIRHLLQHSSGLPDLPDVPAFLDQAINNQTTEISYDDLMGFLAAANGSNRFGTFTAGRLDGFRIGVDVSYSSFGPAIAGQVAEAITGQDIRSLVQSLIIEPLGLTATSHMGFDPDPKDLTEGYADETTVNPFFPDAAATLSFSSANGGAMHADVADLLTYFDAIFNDPTFISAASLAEIFAEPVQGIGLKSGAGMIQFDSWVEAGLWGHAGSGIRSHSATALHNQEANITIVVLTNLNTDLDDHQTNLAVTEAVLKVLAAN